MGPRSLYPSMERLGFPATPRMPHLVTEGTPSHPPLRVPPLHCTRPSRNARHCSRSLPFPHALVSVLRLTSKGLWDLPLSCPLPPPHGHPLSTFLSSWMAPGLLASRLAPPVQTPPCSLKDLLKARCPRELPFEALAAPGRSPCPQFTKACLMPSHTRSPLLPCDPKFPLLPALPYTVWPHAQCRAP